MGNVIKRKEIEEKISTYIQSRLHVLLMITIIH